LIAAVKVADEFQGWDGFDTEEEAKLAYPIKQ
jgi:hypothetical protein